MHKPEAESLLRGNEELISRGGHAFSDAALEEIDDVIGWMKQNVARQPEQEVLAFAYELASLIHTGL